MGAIENVSGAEARESAAVEAAEAHHVVDEAGASAEEKNDCPRPHHADEQPTRQAPPPLRGECAGHREAGGEHAASDDGEDPGAHAPRIAGQRSVWSPKPTRPPANQ